MDKRGFLPGEPETASGRFLNMKDIKKAKNRTVRLRILTPAITGWIKFSAAKKPVRIRDGETFPKIEWGKGLDGKEQVARRFWACAIYNHTLAPDKDDPFQVWEFTQSSVFYSLDKLMDDEDWGDPTTYDLKVSSSGEGMDTEYSVIPGNKAPLRLDIQTAWKALSGSWAGLDALLAGKDPFASGNGHTADPDAFPESGVVYDGTRNAFPFDDVDDPGPEA